MSASSVSSVSVDNASRVSGSGGGDSIVVPNAIPDAVNARGSNCDDDKPIGDKVSASASDGVCDDEEEEEYEEDEEEVEQDVEEDDEIDDDDDDVDGQEDDGGEDEGEEEEEEQEEDEDEETKSSVSNDKRSRHVGSRKPHTSAARLRYGRSNNTNGSDSGGEEDCSDLDDMPRKTIQVGSDFQAKIPSRDQGSYSNEKPYTAEDKLLWDPYGISSDSVHQYLTNIKDQCNQEASERLQALLKEGLSADSLEAALGAAVSALPHGSHVPDDEEALFTLLQCRFEVGEAVRKHATTRQRSSGEKDCPRPWSEEECRNFESGMRMFGKKFNEIQRDKVSTRSVGELVQFYYIWKRSERHDAFGPKARLEKKKYALRPGTTDYADRYLDEPDSSAALDPVHASLVPPSTGAAVVPPTSSPASAASASLTNCPTAPATPLAQPLAQDAQRVASTSGLTGE